MKKFYLLSLFALFSCGRQDFSNTRAYVEGTITSSQTSEDITIEIISNGKSVAATSLSGNRNFVLSGPLFGQGFSLLLSSKIESFDSNRSGLILSADSMSIAVPAGISYLTFNNIRLKP